MWHIQVRCHLSHAMHISFVICHVYYFSYMFVRSFAICVANVDAIYDINSMVIAICKNLSFVSCHAYNLLFYIGPSWILQFLLERISLIRTHWRITSDARATLHGVRSMRCVYSWECFSQFVQLSADRHNWWLLICGYSSDLTTKLTAAMFLSFLIQATACQFGS